jgi:gluconokinase
MASGRALTEGHRAPWLAALAAEVRARLEDGPPAVLASSALRAEHRALLHVDDPRVLLVHLRAEPGLVDERLAARTDQFFPPGLAASQFAALEEPAAALVLDAARPVAELVDAVVAAVG